MNVWNCEIIALISVRTFPAVLIAVAMPVFRGILRIHLYATTSTNAKSKTRGARILARI